MYTSAFCKEGMEMKVKRWNLGNDRCAEHRHKHTWQQPLLAGSMQRAAEVPVGAIAISSLFSECPASVEWKAVYSSIPKVGKAESCQRLVDDKWQEFFDFHSPFYFLISEIGSSVPQSFKVCIFCLDVLSTSLSPPLHWATELRTEVSRGRDVLILARRSVCFFKKNHPDCTSLTFCYVLWTLCPF